MWTYVLVLMALLSPDVARASSLALELPIACHLGQDCWVIHFPDLDPGPGVRDWMCGSRSYDGHHGTDIAIPDLAAMRRGVPVLSAAPGVVRAIRDGMVDVRIEEADRRRIAGRECGNGVLIDHGDGFETQYCHLRNGSVRVRAGEQVGAGTPLGLVGLSGNTDFPHLELVVRYQGRTVDPFRGLAGGAPCGPGEAPLWAPGALAAIPYEPVILTKVGIASGEPDWAVVREGGLAATELPAAIPALVVWIEGYGLHVGDLLRFEVRAADAKTLLFAAESRAEAAKARFFRFAGRRAPPQGFQPGRYQARAELVRDGAVAAARALAFLLR